MHLTICIILQVLNTKCSALYLSLACVLQVRKGNYGGRGGVFAYRYCPGGGVFGLPYGQISTLSPPLPHLGYPGLDIDRRIIV